MAAGRWVGRGDKNGADGVAVNAMRVMISTIGMNGTVVIGEGRKGQRAHALLAASRSATAPAQCDVAVDPIDGTTLTAKGMTNAVSVMAVSPAARCTTLGRVLHGEAGRGRRRRRRGRHPQARRREHPPGRQGAGQAAVRRHRRPPGPPRHAGLVEEIRATGAMIKFISDGDVAGAIMAARPRPGSTCSSGSAALGGSSPPAP